MRSSNYPSPLRAPLQVVGFLALAATCRLPAQVSFLPPATYPTGRSPATLAVADFDGDGRQDLAVAKWDSCSVSVLLGNGDGTFRSGADFLACGYSIAVGDLNGDGRQDVVTCGGSTVSVLLGNGDGTFRAVYLTSGSGFTDSVGVGDFTLDGIPDVVVADTENAVIALFVNRDDGTLADLRRYEGVDAGYYYPTSYPVDLYGPSHVVAGDFNGDGTPDMAAIGGFLVVLINLENPMAIGPARYRLQPADFNGDGYLDLAVRDADTVRILVGNGDGTFRPPAQFAAGPVTSGDHTFVAGDFNGDGKPDLATIISGDEVAVLINSSTHCCPN